MQLTPQWHLDFSFMKSDFHLPLHTSTSQATQPVQPSTPTSTQSLFHTTHSSPKRRHRRTNRSYLFSRPRRCVPNYLTTGREAGSPESTAYRQLTDGERLLRPALGGSHRDHVTDVAWHLRKLLHHFRTCLEEPERALSSLEALPLRRPEFICAIICPCCIGVTDMRVISRCISDPVGMPRWRRVLVRLSRSLDMGRGEVAVTETKQNIQLHRLLKLNRGVKAKQQQNQVHSLLEYVQRKWNPIPSWKLLPSFVLPLYQHSSMHIYSSFVFILTAEVPLCTVKIIMELQSLIWMHPAGFQNTWKTPTMYGCIRKHLLRNNWLWSTQTL